MKIKRSHRISYITWFLILLVLEILIAIFLKDDLIRPYGGDFLAVILLYCLLMAITQITVIKGLLTVLLISFGIEFFQIINIVKVMQYQPPEPIMTIIGKSFSYWDLLAYSLGILLTAFIEFYFNSYRKHHSS